MQRRTRNTTIDIAVSTQAKEFIESSEEFWTNISP